MGRFLAGVLSTLLLVAAGFFIWKSRAEGEDPIPPPPAATPVYSPMGAQAPAGPPSADKSREEKRFGRADKDKDGRVTREEMLAPRRKAYAKLDTNGDGRLVFDEWAVTTSTKFAGADADRSGWLSPREFMATRPKTSPKKKCAC